MSRARDEYIQLIFDKIEREKAARAASPPPVALPPALAPKLAPALIAPPTAVDREFDAVRTTALARIETETKLRQAESKAVTAILSAAPSAPSDAIRLPNYATPEDLAVAAILRAGISPR